jgi:uncharacterized membrane protein YwzB
MTYSILRFALFILCFGLSIWTLFPMRWEVLWKHPDRSRALILLFLLSLILAHLATEAILALTVMNGFA